MMKTKRGLFIIAILLFTTFIYASTFIDNSQSNFNSGTYNWTFYNSSGFVQLNSSRLNGNYTSQIFNAGDSSQWNNISWTSNAIGELPNYQANEITSNTFGSGNINMTGNVLLLHLNNASGENATLFRDWSSGINNGTCSNCPAYNTSGKLNSAYTFDGTNDFISIPDTADWILGGGTGNFAIGLWTKLPTLVQDNWWIAAFVAQDEGSGATNKWIFSWDGATDKLVFHVNTPSAGGPEIRSNVLGLAKNTWYHFTIVRDGNVWRFYKDGVAVGAPTQAVTIPNGATPLRIGYGEETGGFEGTIDELAIWNRSLSATEILDIYKRGALRLNLSVQSCDDASCEGESFIEINDTSPQNLSITNNTYFQYRFEFETDNSSYTPELYNVTVDYTILNRAPTLTLNSPSNNSYHNAVTSVLLNATVYDLDLNNMTVWFYGGYANGTYTLINTTYNQTNGTSVAYNWTGLASLGQYNWTVIENDGTLNSTNEYFFFNLINLTVNCEAGGGYQQGALVLIQGNVTNGTSGLNSQSVNLTVYDANNNLDASANLTSTNDGSFETTFSGLAVGSYTLYANTTYQGFNKSCIDTFVVGSPADFVLDKIISLYNMTNTTINYNITLRTVNKGGSDATSTTLTDSDSSSSPYNLGTVSANSSVLRSYLKEYTRNSTTYNSTLAIASVNATDSYSGNQISVNSSEIVLIIPSSPTGQQLTLVKNAYYNSENSTAVNYSLSVDVVNSGGVDLTSISLIDTDLDINTNINLNRTQNYSSSGSVIIDKAASNTNKLFVKASATVNSVTYQSNQVQVRIPGYGGPADLTVYAPASVSTSTSFDTTIKVENQNLDIGQDFTTDYWITSNDESVNYTSGQQTVYVAASGTSNITATLTSPSNARTYRYRASTSWAGGTVTAFDSFTVTAPSSGGGGSSGGGSGGSITGRATEEVVCNPPYIRYEKGCCLDSNNNSICDTDESLKSPEEENKTSDIGEPEEENKTSDIGEPEEEIPSKTQTFLSNVFGRIGSFFKNSLGYVKQNNLYFIIGFGSLIFVLLLIIVIIKISRKKKKSRILSDLETKLKHLKELKKKKDISEKSYHVEKEELLQKINKILKNKHFVLILGAIGLIGLFATIIKPSITGGAIGIGKFTNINWLAIFVVLIILLLIGILAILFYIIKEIREIKDKINKVGNSEDKIVENEESAILGDNSPTQRGYKTKYISELTDKKVYTNSGHYIGSIKEIILMENRIDSLRIKLDKKQKFKIKGIIIKYNNVKGIGQVVIINSAILDMINSLKV